MGYGKFFEVSFLIFFLEKRERERNVRFEGRIEKYFGIFIEEFLELKVLESLFQSSFGFLSSCLIFLGNGRILDRGVRKLYWNCM